MFGFPKVEHKKYNKNFLKTVVFQLQFEKCLNLESKESEIGQIFKNNFPRLSGGKGKGFEIILNNENANFQQVNNGHNINMKSENGQRIIDINETGLSFTIGGSSYISFENLIQDINNIITFLDLCEINSIKRLAIRKINIVEFKNNENPSDILNFLINPSLVGHIQDFPNRNLINHSIQSLNYKENDKYLNIKYGLNIPPQLNSELGQLIIDIDLYRQEVIETKNIISESKLMNSEIFNIFNWLINDNTKQLLNG